MKNKKTTIAGISAILLGLGGLAQSLSSGDYAHLEASIAGIIAGIGLIVAKDHNVTGGSIQQ